MVSGRARSAAPALRMLVSSRCFLGLDEFPVASLFVRFLGFRLLLVLIAVLVLVPCLFSSVYAAETRVVQVLFGGSCTPEGELHGCVPDPSPLSGPQGVAVDQSIGAPSSGFVYVPDAGAPRGQVFTEERVFVFMFGQNVNKLGRFSVERHVCNAGEECQEGAAGTAPRAFDSPAFVAVDNDPSSASFHDLYVADTADRIVSKFSPSVALVESWRPQGYVAGSCTGLGWSSVFNGSFCSVRV